MDQDSYTAAFPELEEIRSRLERAFHENDQSLAAELSRWIDAFQLRLWEKQG